MTIVPRTLFIVAMTIPLLHITATTARSQYPVEEYSDGDTSAVKAKFRINGVEKCASSCGSGMACC